MLLLVKSKLDPSLYKVGVLDAPGNGSMSSMYQNIIECSSLLNPFEDVYSQILPTFNGFGYSIYDYQDFEDKVKPLYQYLRHGLAFDWVLNYVVGRIYEVFPFFTFRKFKGTDPFIEQFKNDEIFKSELSLIDSELDKLIDVLSLDLDKTVFTRLVNDSGTNDFIECVRWARDHGRVSDFYITEDLIYNMNYLVALGLMLEKCTGIVKRNVWHDSFTNIKAGTLDGILMCGGKFRAFAYGKLWDDEPKWHRFDLGIQMDIGSSRTQRKDFVRVFPDEMTFFRFTPNTIMIDESYFPLVSFDSGTTWMNALQFEEAQDLPLDKPLKMSIKYKFKQDPNNPRIIKVKAKANCVVKDYELFLDENGIAETQIMFRGDSIGFKISETAKEYPFAVFNNSKLKIKDFEWL